MISRCRAFKGAQTRTRALEGFGAKSSPNKNSWIVLSFTIGVCPLWDHGDGAEMALRYQDYISLQGQSFPVRRAYYLTWKSRFTSSMVQRMGDRHSRRAWLILQSPYFKESLYLWTSYSETRTCFCQSGQLIPGFSKERALMTGDCDSRYRRRNAAGIVRLV